MHVKYSIVANQIIYLIRLKVIQKRAFRMLFPEASCKEALEMTGMPTLYERRETLCKEFFQSICENNNKKLLFNYYHP